MIEPTLFVALDSQVQDRICDLHAAAAEARSPRLGAEHDQPGLVTRTRESVGRFLVSLGSQVAGQPQA
jgi:hypothetical protein